MIEKTKYAQFDFAINLLALGCPGRDPNEEDEFDLKCFTTNFNMIPNFTEEFNKLHSKTTETEK